MESLTFHYSSCKKRKKKKEKEEKNTNFDIISIVYQSQNQEFKKKNLIYFLI